MISYNQYGKLMLLVSWVCFMYMFLKWNLFKWNEADANDHWIESNISDSIYWYII